MKLLVNAPSGAQEVIDVGVGGGYFDAARVLWDERSDGPLPAITLGGMLRSGNALSFDQARMDQSTAALAPALAEGQRISAIDAAIGSDTTIASLKAMSSADFDAWWTANVTTLAQANNVLKRIARVVLRRVL